MFKKVYYVVLVILIGSCWFMNYNYNNLEKDYIKLEHKLDLVNLELKSLQETLKTQNKRIEEYKSKLSLYNQEIQDKTDNIKELSSKYQEQVKESLSKDSSDKNQLNLVNRMLHEFSKEN